MGVNVEEAGGDNLAARVERLGRICRDGGLNGRDASANSPPLGSPSESARSPLAPRNRFYF